MSQKGAAADGSGVFGWLLLLMSGRNLGDVYIEGSRFLCACDAFGIYYAHAASTENAPAPNVMSHCGSPTRIWKYLCWRQSGNYKVWGIYGMQTTIKQAQWVGWCDAQCNSALNLFKLCDIWKNVKCSEHICIRPALKLWSCLCAF